MKFRPMQPTQSVGSWHDIERLPAQAVVVRDQFILVGHRRQALFDGRNVRLGLAPETFDLRLEVGETLFEFGKFQHSCCRDDTQNNSIRNVERDAFLLRQRECHVTISAPTTSRSVHHTREV